MINNNNNNNNNNKDLERLINITKSIYKIYCEKAKNKDQNKLDQYLDLALEIENEIYYNLNISINNCDDLVITFSKLLHEREDTTEEEKEVIEARFENYIIHIIYGNPFTSMEKNKNRRLEENSAIIRTQVSNEYHNNLIYYLLETANTTKSKREKKTCLELYNMILFNNKNLEKTKPIKLKNNGRQKCILFNHKENLINSVYEEYLFDAITETINCCLTFSDENLKNHKYKIEQNINIQYLRTALSLLTKKEIGRLLIDFKKNILANAYYSEIIKENTKSVSMIKNSIRQAALEKSKNYTKQKI